MPTIKRRPPQLAFKQRAFARGPEQSAYPHLWRGAVALVAPSLGFQANQLYDWSGNLLPGVVSRLSNSGQPWILGAGRPFASPNAFAFAQGEVNATDVVTFPHSQAINLTGSMTLMCWFQMTSTGIVFQFVLSHASVTEENWNLYIRNSGNIGFEYKDGIVKNIEFTVPSFTVGQWYHYAIVVKDAGSVTAYRDGLQIAAAQTITGLTACANASFFIGQYGGALAGTFRSIGRFDDARVYNRALSPQEIYESYAINLAPFQPHARRTVFNQPADITKTLDPARMQWKAGSITGPRVLTPARMKWQVQGLSVPQTVTLGPARMEWQTQRLTRTTGGLSENLTPAAIAIYANTLTAALTQSVNLTRGAITIYANTLAAAGQTVTLGPARMQWQTPGVHTIVGVVSRDCGPAYDAALALPFIAGDWLIQAPAIGLKQSFHYDPDSTWDHHIVDIADIEISVTPGGGIASVANVTFRLAESNLDTGTPFKSIVEVWESAESVENVEVTIDFLLDSQTTSLRIFTGHIDTISVQDAVSTFLCVDSSIAKNLMIPQTLVDTVTYPNADSRVLTQPIPLLYGRGVNIGAAPLLLVDVTTNTYLLCNHPATIGGKLAVYDQQTATYLTLDSIIPVVNNADATITLGTLDTGIMGAREQSVAVTDAPASVDGNSLTQAIIGTALTDSNGIDGIGYLGWTAQQVGYPNTPTFQVTLTNHRRSPGSDPITGGTFTVRTIDPSSGGTLRTILTTETFKQVTSGQNNIYTLSNQAIGLNELLDVLLTVRCEGTVGNISQTYQIGEVSITPLVAFSANASGSPTAVRVPVTVQELRFNPLTPALSVIYQQFVTDASFAADGISTTIAYVGTSGTDSNLDGIGQLIVGTVPTSAQRANNTLVVNMVNHRRGISSDPTVTGLFEILTLNEVTGVPLRQNLFTTQQFRQQLNPLTTSFTAPSINLGATEQVAVRLVARNEGGPGNGNQYYEVGDISLQSFYQPRGDSQNIVLFGEGYSGRYDVNGDVTSYSGQIGQLLTYPDEVIASIFIQELGLTIDSASFAVAFTFFANIPFVFDGGIGMDWAVQRQNARELLDTLARTSTSILAPSFSGEWGLRPYRTDVEPRAAFDISNILYTSGAQDQREEDRQSTFVFTLGNLQTVYNRFEVHYQYDVGSRKYNSVYFVDQDGTNVPEGLLDRDVLLARCAQSFQRYGKLEPLVIECNWIADGTAAFWFLRHLVLYFSEQRVVVQFETTFTAACLQVGDFITVTYPGLPLADDGSTYEIHTIRYKPVEGRIFLLASRSATLDIVVSIEPVRMAWRASGSASNGTPGILPSSTITLAPARMQWRAQASTLTLADTMELWEYLPTFTIGTPFLEGWES